MKTLCTAEPIIEENLFQVVGVEITTSIFNVEKKMINNNSN